MAAKHFGILEGEKKRVYQERSQATYEAARNQSGKTGRQS